MIKIFKVSSRHFSGFHEAIGDALMLSAKTPLYLKSIGLIDQASNSTGKRKNLVLAIRFIRICFVQHDYHTVCPERNRRFTAWFFRTSKKSRKSLDVPKVFSIFFFAIVTPD